MNRQSGSEHNYYSPEVEEFHVGFEYERLSYDNKWLKGDDGFPIHLTPQEALNYRVKYLDAEDIESFGFKSTIIEYRTPIEMSLIDTILHAKYKFSESFSLVNKEELMEHRMTYTYDSNRLVIYNILSDDEANNGTLFKGIIKNKSELIKLLKQLGLQN